MSCEFADRADAGRRLAAHLREHLSPGSWLVLGLPRGGVPIAAAVASTLGAELDCWIVRKLGAPGQPEFAVGALAEGGIALHDNHALRLLGVAPDALADVIRRETAELARRAALYRAGRGAPEVRGRRVLLVDDGLATGATLRAAIRAVRAAGAAHVAIAVPVASVDGWAMTAREADEAVCLLLPPTFAAVGEWYAAFPSVSDEEVIAHLALH